MHKHFLGLRTCIYRVKDLEAAKTWYTKILDMPPYFDEPFYVGYEVSGYELGLIPFEGENTVEERNPDSFGKGPSSDNIHIYWGVEDIHASYQRLIDLGATTDEAPNNVGGEIMVATLKDPWGNIFGIIYNPHFKLP
jgi:catechol 2,3-dioxygenase-like lactoylglutathione lyase family enzyme